MKLASRFQAALAIAVLTLGAATVVSASSKNTETRLRTRLAGAAIQGKTPEGNAEFRSDSRGRTSFKVEVENVNLPDGTLDVSVQSGGVTTPVGHIKLRAGEGELELNSQDGDTVPTVQKGDMVMVSNAGTTILAGVF